MVTHQYTGAAESIQLWLYASNKNVSLEGSCGDCRHVTTHSTLKRTRIKVLWFGTEWNKYSTGNSWSINLSEDVWHICHIFWSFYVFDRSKAALILVTKWNFSTFFSVSYLLCPLNLIILYLAYEFLDHSLKGLVHIATLVSSKGTQLQELMTIKE